MMTQHKKKKRYSYEYRRGQVERFLRGREMTSYDLAEHLGLSQQNTLKLLKRMADEGLVSYHEEPHRSNISKKVWTWGRGVHNE